MKIYQLRWLETIVFFSVTAVILPFHAYAFCEGDPKLLECLESTVAFNQNRMKDLDRAHKEQCRDKLKECEQKAESAGGQCMPFPEVLEACQNIGHSRSKRRASLQQSEAELEAARGAPKSIDTALSLKKFELRLQGCAAPVNLCMYTQVIAETGAPRFVVCKAKPDDNCDEFNECARNSAQAGTVRIQNEAESLDKQQLTPWATADISSCSASARTVTNTLCKSAYNYKSGSIRYFEASPGLFPASCNAKKSAKLCLGFGEKLEKQKDLPMSAEWTSDGTLRGPVVCQASPMNNGKAGLACPSHFGDCLKAAPNLTDAQATGGQPTGPGKTVLELKSGQAL
ncbi:hypothetical protein WDW37_20010 [Bdellovibrionota bacterium FG-1]